MTYIYLFEGFPAGGSPDQALLKGASRGNCWRSSPKLLEPCLISRPTFRKPPLGSSRRKADSRRDSRKARRGRERRTGSEGRRRARQPRAAVPRAAAAAAGGALRAAADVGSAAAAQPRLPGSRCRPLQAVRLLLHQGLRQRPELPVLPPLPGGFQYCESAVTTAKDVLTQIFLGIPYGHVRSTP